MNLHTNTNDFAELIRLTAVKFNILPIYIEKDYLMNDTECAEYIRTPDFQKELFELFTHDQQEFDEPKGWQTKTIKESSLITDFPAIWKSIRPTYQSELTNLAFTAIPDEELVEKNFQNLISCMQIACT
jgi:hypothetical protein